MADDHPEFMDLEQTAEFLHIRPRTLRRWIKEGKVTPVPRLGRKLLFSRDALRRLLDPPGE
jgi:excisionase family DNA binding protein